METKQIDVTCPCCATRITVDVLTRTVLRHAPPEQVDDTGKVRLDAGRWDAAAERVGGRREAAEDKLEQALARERDKESRFDELFDRANEKARRPDEDD